MNLGQSIRSGVKWLMIGKLGNRLMEFLFGVVLARLLVPADFGMIATVTVFTGFVGMFTSGGMGQSLIRAKAADTNDFTAVFTLQLALGILVYLGFFIAAPWIAHLFDQPLYKDLIRVSALSFLLRPFPSIRNIWLNRKMDFKSRSMVNVTGGVVTGFVSVLMAWFGMGVWSLTLSGILSTLFQNFWLARLTPLKLHLNMDFPTMRKHSAYGVKIVATDFVSYLRSESKGLILSKLAGPSFLGLFKKAESLSRLPNQLMMSATMDPLFRAMSKSQYDLDLTKYLFYRAITLLTVYTTPIYVLLWWVGEPFISIVYGEKWLQVSAPMKILITAGIFLNIIHPCGVLMAAQNRVGQEIFAQSLNLLIIIAACYFGLNWGLEGVAWGIVLSHALLVFHFYWIVHQILPTRIVDLIKAIAPGFFLSTLLFFVLKLIDVSLGELNINKPLLYLLIMSFCGSLFYLTTFLFIPIPALKTEVSRFRKIFKKIFEKIKTIKPVNEPLIDLSLNVPLPLSSDNYQSNRLVSPKKVTKIIYNNSVFIKNPSPQIFMANLSKHLLTFVLLLALAGVTMLLYSARGDLKPYINRWIAGEEKWFHKETLPQRSIPYIFDLGIVDANQDGHLDIYTSNHNYQQLLWISDGRGGYSDKLTEWELDQVKGLPGWEQSMGTPVMENSGVYIYWQGDTVHIRSLDAANPPRFRMHIYSKVEITHNEGFQIEQSETKALNDVVNETNLIFIAPRNGQLAMYIPTRGGPVNFGLDKGQKLSDIFLGSQKVPIAKSFFSLPAEQSHLVEWTDYNTLSLFLKDRHGMAWADFNDDGQLDLFMSRGAMGGSLRNFPDHIRARVNDELLVSNHGTPKFKDEALEIGLHKRDCSSRHTKWVDFNQDGHLDLFINCLDRGNVLGSYKKQLYIQTADRKLIDVADNLGLDIPEHELIDFAWLDVDNDGHLDLVTHEDSGYYFYRKKESKYTREFIHRSRFERSDIPQLKGDTSDYWQFDGKMTFGDYDNDGDLDIFTASKKGNILLINKSGKYTPIEPTAMGLPSSSVSAAWLDYDNDGKLDLYTVPEGLFRQTDNNAFNNTGYLQLSPNKYQAAIINWFDKDNDGSIDVLIALEDNATLWRWWEKPFKHKNVKGRDDRFNWRILSYRNIGPVGHWIQLNLVGAAGNPQAIGARVTITTQLGKQTQTVGASEGAYLSQGHYRLYFGLGSQEQARTIHIQWPDGGQQELNDVQADRLLTVQQRG